MKDSKIEWTDHTFNPWIGCTRVSPGCVNCYAETMMADRYKKVKWGPQGLRVRTSTDYWKQPFKWNRQAAAEGVRRRVFCASLADVFEDKADQREGMEAWRLDLFYLIQQTPHLDWLLLTKRPDNALVWFDGLYQDDQWRWGVNIDEDDLTEDRLRNVWIGTSVEDQRRADERIPHLLAIPAAVRFLSVEPLLGPVDLGLFGTVPGCTDNGGHYHLTADRINWVICGGESGPNARPMNPDWARSLRDQCQAAAVPFFFKQWGEYGPCTEIPGQAADPDCMFRFGKKLAGRLLDGREWNEFPNDDGGAR